ncbi:recombinase family protein [Candidatus Magnetaquicoccus inordinatus]|uniref:recombinase family protein n=1 Tax=Candidatus Magnetaquicoccus inordinatus TaxID=2496818 RepID=UPI00187D233C|nr:recombinase family protein [Candidatus Magnetaquicoccus inordinatus]
MKISLGDSTKAVLFIRVSTEEQHLGPKAQKDAIERWCQFNGVSPVATFQESISGGAGLEHRHELMAAIDCMKTSGAGILLVAKRDRLARDSMLAAMIERLVERAGGRVVSADGVGNGTGPEAQLMRGMIDLFAQYERALIRSRTTAAMAVKRSKGERVGGIPFGYCMHNDGVTLLPHETEQETIQTIANLRNSGMTLKAITEKLNSDGIPSRGSRWHVTSVVNVLQKFKPQNTRCSM